MLTQKSHLTIIVCIISGISITDTTFSTTCYGSQPDCTTHKLECKAPLVIYITNAIYGFRPGCSAVGISNCDDIACCISQDNDCILPFNRSSVEGLQRNCSGNTTCKFRGQLSDQMCDKEKDLRYSSYSQIEFECVIKGQTPTTTPAIETTSISPTTTPLTLDSTTKNSNDTPTRNSSLRFSSIPTTSITENSTSETTPNSSSVSSSTPDSTSLLSSTPDTNQPNTSRATGATIGDERVTNSNLKLIIGSAVGGLLGILIIIIAAVNIYRWKRRSRKNESTSTNSHKHKNHHMKGDYGASNGPYDPYYSTIRSLEGRLSSPPVLPAPRRGILRDPKRY
ncbi:hypothetical protein SNE40_020642 [Patella caerulea]|uniref:Mid2 domain-containing protein n=1 Tax=Patella caerulea TaxID=87958 RepID=A0AAN8J6B7_PATCE